MNNGVFESITNAMVVSYLDSLIGKLHKIKPMRISDDQTLPVYLNSFLFELHGSFDTFPCLAQDARYVTVVNIVSNMCSNPFTKDEARREVEKAISLVKKIASDIAG